LQSAFFSRIRHPGAATISGGEAVDWNPQLLRGRHCVLVSYRADGTPVPTPVWVAVDGDRVFMRTGADAFKVKRVRRDPTILLAPSTSRGRPTGAAMPGLARVLGRDEEPVAERALRARHGLLRRFYSRTVDDHLPTVYIEIGPRPAEKGKGS
jgi:PPOX class probable F420-dependent enzyme